MNFKSKLRVKNPLATIISLVVVAALSVFLQGCEKDDFFD